MRTFLLLAFLPLPLGLLAAPAVPSSEETEKLTHDSLLAFNQAVQTQDFTAFYGQTAKLWQDQTKPAELKKIFQTFIDQKIDLAPVIQTEPTFSKPPEIDKDGVLSIEGRYPSKPIAADFRLKYISEGGVWKLIGIEVNAAPASEAPAEVPTEKEAQALVRASLLAFNQAIERKDFAGFYKEIADGGQKHTTPEKLQENFQSFIDKEIDLSPVEKLTPSFEKPPALDENGILALNGSYALKPDSLRFELSYVYEGSSWKLVGIKVNLDRAEGDETESNEQ